jgi:hypothetical protein
LPTFTFGILFPGKNNLVVRKEGRCAQKASAGGKIHSEIHPWFRWMRRDHRAPSHAFRVTPLHRNTPVLWEKTACPPGPRKEARLMIFARNALPSGPGNACNSIDLTPAWRKVKVGKTNGPDPRPSCLLA